MLVLTAISVIQAVREFVFWQSPYPSCEEFWPQGGSFKFAGRAILVVRPPVSAADSASGFVKQERVMIDGQAVGQNIDLRMRNWPHWFDAVRFTDTTRGDSSLWLARRLQPADSVQPLFEIVTIDADGAIKVELRNEHQLRTEYRVARVTQFIGEDAPSGFPLSTLGFLQFPILLLIHPLLTVVIASSLLRRSRTS